MLQLSITCTSFGLLKLATIFKNSILFLIELRKKTVKNCSGSSAFSAAPKVVNILVRSKFWISGHSCHSEPANWESLFPLKKTASNNDKKISAVVKVSYWWTRSRILTGLGWTLGLVRISQIRRIWISILLYVLQLFVPVDISAPELWV